MADLIKDINEDDLIQTDWENRCGESIERRLSVNCFPETEAETEAVYQARMLAEDGSEEHYEQLVEVLRNLHPVMLREVWLKEFVMTEAMRGLTTIRRETHGHLNVLAETQRPKFAIVVRTGMLKSRLWEPSSRAKRLSTVLVIRFCFLSLTQNFCPRF